MNTSHIGNMVKQMMSGLAVAVIALMSALPAQADRTTTFYHTDHLGSVVAISNEAGEVIRRTDFHDYGSADRQMSVSGERENQRLGYTGKYFDEHTNTAYLGARFYDPDLGRFLTPDPVGFNEKNLFLFNRYAYGNNNPYLYSDPDGNQPAEFYGAEPVRSQYAGGRLVSDYCYSCAHYRAPTPEETDQFLRNTGRIVATEAAFTVVFLPAQGVRWSGKGVAALRAIFASKVTKSVFSVNNKQLGNKLGKHVQDFGGNPANPADRNRVTDLINDIGTNPDKTVRGTFAGQGANGGRGAVGFRIKGNDVVVTKPDGSFVTILKDGVNNTSVKEALGGS